MSTAHTHLTQQGTGGVTNQPAGELCTAHVLLSVLLRPFCERKFLGNTAAVPPLYSCTKQAAHASAHLAYPHAPQYTCPQFCV